MSKVTENFSGLYLKLIRSFLKMASEPKRWLIDQNLSKLLLYQKRASINSFRENKNLFRLSQQLKLKFFYNIFNSFDLIDISSENQTIAKINYLRLFKVGPHNYMYVYKETSQPSLFHNVTEFYIFLPGILNEAMPSANWPYFRETIPKTISKIKIIYKVLEIP